MRRYRFTADAGRTITAFGSHGLTLTRILHAAGPTVTSAMWLAPGGSVGRHPASDGQLFLVVQGAGWVEGGDGARQPIAAGEAALWDDGEEHASGTEGGMTALVIEGDALTAAWLRTLPPLE